MNARSSRSHAICTLSFEVVRPGTGGQAAVVSSSKFHLVDLAGSEGVGKTGIEVCVCCMFVWKREIGGGGLGALWGGYRDALRDSRI